MGVELFHTDSQTNGRTDGHDEANSHFSQLCERFKKLRIVSILLRNLNVNLLNYTVSNPDYCPNNPQRQTYVITKHDLNYVVGTHCWLKNDMH